MISTQVSYFYIYALYKSYSSSVCTLGKRMGFTKSKRTDFSKNASLARFFGKNGTWGWGHEWRKTPPKRVKNGENQN